MAPWKAASLEVGQMLNPGVQAACSVLITGGILGLLGCSTPYQAKGFRGGYSSFETQPGVYYVSFQGNAFTSRETVVQYWHQRTAEICGGRDRYETIQHSASTEQDVQGTAAGVHTTTKHRAEGYIRCVAR